ncbi:C-X-C chemokine receptor type 3-like [Paralichthys olivaceus]|uniref:C-X-C chemokine receptor type 3-like n=1 Tax=Paralichthys olivaceus TaxID=8255 RepID=UPI00097DFD2C|nr:PREDICTED: C-X-C chemokine receptor type 3-like [Paralichthys olivaceus]XP_019948636.1 PREDICTED: C-X-C chemokine receptor type 3-like [Paralichthys olivaceus]XP_019948637.1 PREDICTED: C-X-C chemokine receptor type 3-like [Paralichthys olivaceus]XP_019948639.1 PREDICTED: C-X-C chemokine receptor type 3-like [Paralichthys olivaceus]
MNMEVELGGFLSQNSTYDYNEDYEYKGDEESEGRKAVLIPLLYSAMLVVGLLGNLLLLVILAQKRRSWSISDTFILHFGVADILLLATLPLRAIQAAEHGWRFGAALCKISGAVFNFNFYCGILLLACISVDRCLSIVHNTQLFSHKKCVLVHLSCLSAWFISLILTIPDWIFLTAAKDDAQIKNEKTVCVNDYSQSVIDLRLFSHLCHTLGFLLPAVIVIFCCARILLQLRQRSKSLHKQTAIMVLLPLVSVFFVFWVPYIITLIVGTFRNYSLTTALMVTAALGYVHACLRPLLYFCLCGNFRKRTIALLTCAKDESRRSLWELGVGEEALPDQSHEAEGLKQMTSEELQVQSLSADQQTNKSTV